MTHAKLLHLPVLTGLRFVAACGVLFAHAIHNIFSLTGGYLYHIGLQLAYFSMALFFVLSGCVLMMNYAEAFIQYPIRTLHNFWVSRIARLYPLYLFCIFLYLAITPLTSTLFYHVLPWNFFLVQSWFFSLARNAATFFPHAWSISAEMFLYLLLPVFIWLLLKSRSWILDVFIFLFLYICTIFILLKAYYSIAIQGVTEWHGMNVVLSTQFLPWVAYYSPYVHLNAFLAGCIVGKYILHNQHEKLLDIPNHRLSIKIGNLFIWIIFGTILALFFNISPADPRQFLNRWDLPKCGVLYVPIISLFVYGVAKCCHPITLLLSTRFFQFFGETSYSIYLLHPMIIVIFLFNMPLGSIVTLSDPSRWFRLSACIIFTFVISYGTYVLIEVPGRRWVRNKLILREKAILAVTDNYLKAEQ